MTPAGSLCDPERNADLYVSAVLTLYVDLPDTPLRASLSDQHQARTWFERGVTLPLAETALLLASLRRLSRPPGIPALPRIRSLAYFQPVVEELTANSVPEGYLQYLRLKLRYATDRAEPNGVQKTTFPGDR